MYDEVDSAEGKTDAHDSTDDVQSGFGRRELLQQLDPADGHAETMVALLACMNMAGDCFALRCADSNMDHAVAVNTVNIHTHRQTSTRSDW